jgi:uncharacterized protein YfaS (alpha-2-macroglobulin family)
MNTTKQCKPTQSHRLGRRPMTGISAFALVVWLVIGAGAGSAVMPVPPVAPGVTGPGVAPASGNTSNTPNSPASVTAASSSNPYSVLKAPKSDGRLHLVLASPKGQLRLVTKSTELRWVFDRPIIALSTIDQRTQTRPADGTTSTIAALAAVDPSKYVHIEPAIEGSFRWSSTRVLVFTPAKKLPASTHFDVTLSGVTALDGTTLAAPVDSSFDTPRVNCTEYGTDKAWNSGRANGAVLVTCDQEVDGADVAAHVTFAVQSVVDDLASFRPSDADFAAIRLADPKGAALLEARLAELSSATVFERSAVLSKSGPCPDRGKRTITCHWLTMGSPTGNTEAANGSNGSNGSASSAVPGVSAVSAVSKNSADLPLDADVQLRFADGIASKLGKLTSLFIQPISLRTPTALLAAIDCTKECDPEGGLNLSLRSEVSAKSLDGKITLTAMDATGKLGTATTYRYKSDDDAPLSLLWADIAPGGTYRLELDPTITDINGRTLGYRYLATVSFGHRRAYVQLPSGEFVSASTLSPLTIPVRNVTAVDQVIRALTIDTLQETLLATQRRDAVALLGLERDRKEVLLSQATASLDTSFDFPLELPGGPSSTGTFLVAIRGKRFVPQSTYDATSDWQVAIVQRGDRGVTLKRSPIDVLVAVTSLATGKPGIAGGSAAGAGAGDQVRVAALPFSANPQDPSVPGNVAVAVPAKSLRVDVTDGQGFVKLPPPSCPIAAIEAPTGGANGSGAGAAKRASTLPSPGAPSDCELVVIVTAADGSALAYNRSSWFVGGGPRPFEDGIRGMSPIGDPLESVAEEGNSPAAQPGATVVLPIAPNLPVGERFVGALFTDRGVYKGGEEVHVRGTLRVEFPRGVKLLPKDFLPKVGVTVTDDAGSETWRGVVAVDQGLARGGFDAVFTLPADARQGTYTVAVLNGQVSTSFLSTTYRRPDFKVDVALDRPSYVPGETISGSSTGTYLFGAPMAGLESKWVATASPTSFDPSAGHPDLKLRNFTWTYVCIWYENCDDRNEQGAIGTASAKLDSQGKQPVSISLPTNNKRHSPLDVTVEAIVTNVDRQVIANRATTLVHVGDYSLGVKSSTYFGTVGKPIDAQVAALKADGTWQSGALVKTSLVRWDWPEEPNSQGSYTPKATVISRGSLTTSASVSDFAFTPNQPGTYELRVESTDARGNHIEAGVTTYVLGKGASFGQRDSSNIELTASAETYAIGDQAQVLVKSPWPVAEGIVTVERDDIMSYARISIIGGAAALTIPISEESLPNVHVSVMLFRVAPAVPETPETPETPAIAAQEPMPQVLTSSLLLRVPPVSRTLGVKVSTDVTTYRPGSEAAATIQLTDLKGGPLDGSVTLWAVDEGVLRLTGYTVPDVLTQLWSQRPNRVQTSDSRTRSLFTERAPGSESKLRRMKAMSTSGDAAFLENAAPQAAAPISGRFDVDKPAPKDGGGSQPITLRTDFRVLAHWQGSALVNGQGSATLPLKLPQSLTSYRVIAVASSGNDRFGGASTVLEIRQPFMVQPALPRFVAVGDTFEAGAVLQNQTGKPGQVSFTLDLPADSPVAIDGPATQTLTLPVGPTEVRFRLRADRLGTLNAQFQAVLTGAGTGRDESDAVQISVPVLLTHRLETVAAAGQVIASSGGAQEVEQIVPPLSVVPDQGGLEINTASSALVGLQNGVDYLVEYPYGCLEQRSSRLRALVMLNDLRDQFPLPSLAGEKFKQSITAEMSRIRNYLTPEGGLGYWEGNNSSDVYLSARVLILLLDARDLGVDVPNEVITRVTGYLSGIVENVKSQSLRRPLQDNDGVWPNRAHILYALARAGAPDTELMAKLWTRRAELPVLEQLHLVNAMVLGGMKGIRANKLYGELLSSVRVEADQAFLQDETSREAWDRFVCPCSAYLHAGNTHNTAELLSLLVKADPQNSLAPQMARWLMAQRDKQGRWDNTLENGYALTALVNYYRAAEPTAPNFKAEVLLGTTSAFEKVFSGRSLAAQSTQIPMNKLSSSLNAQVGGTSVGSVPLTVKATGLGTLFWSARLRYEPATKNLKALDAGFAVERTYLPYAGPASKTVNGVSTFAAGDLVRVSLKVRTAQNRRNVVIDDPIPAGLEPLDARLSSTSQNEVSGGAAVVDGSSFGIDHVEIQDNRVLLFATGLEPGTFTYTYVARATAPGTFIAAPTQAEEMYRPEIFGRTATATMVITPPKP